MIKKITVINETPLLISSLSKNYMKSIDFIPSTTLKGAYLSRIIDGDKLFKEKSKPQTSLSFTDAFPSMKCQMNVPSLATLSKDESGKIADKLNVIIDELEGRKKIGEEVVRLKKGPRNWFLDGEVKEIRVKRFHASVIEVDPKLKTVRTVRENNEIKGLFSHVIAISPGHQFTFEVKGEEQEIQELESMLKNGEINVGALRTDGYGKLRLLKAEKEEVEIDDRRDDFLVMDIYGYLPYSKYTEALEALKEFFDVKVKIVSIEERRSLDYDEWEVRNYVRTGSVVLLKRKKDIKEELYNSRLKDIVVNSIESGGRIFFNHKVHEKQGS
ncbi:hypothetical protein [Sulfuracidifex tepidarius]|uniref:hypothetical protein n=1 Tax=Sulfuracidifex tepidarius TaxID=1294262 RepID=UPI0011F377A3|nr:hypothetical protein [Sulfuracidifex tepidarius]